MIRVVPACQSMAGLLSRLQCRYFFEAPWTEAALRAFLAEPTCLSYVALAKDDDVQGYVLCRVVGDEAEILSIAVRCAARRTGIGSLLVAEVVSEVRAQRGDRILLEVARDNEAAHCLYGKFGFRPVATRKRYYRRAAEATEDAIVLVCKVGQRNAADLTY